MEKLEYPHNFHLENRVAVVTGGAGFLGKYFCRGLAQNGAWVVVVDLDADRVRKFAEELNTEYGAPTLGLVCDVTSPDSVRKMVGDTVNEFGGIHILHNNAATRTENPDDFFADFEDYSPKVWRQVMEVNIDGMFLVAQAVGKQMIKQGRGGSIIQTSSIYGTLGADKRIYQGSQEVGRPINTPAVYSASKAAVGGLTRYLATYWADAGVRVNTLSPGGVQGDQNEEFVHRYSERIPMRRMGRPEEIVQAMLFLASDASSYVTGQNLVVDGGLQAW